MYYILKIQVVGVSHYYMWWLPCDLASFFSPLFLDIHVSQRTVRLKQIMSGSVCKSFIMSERIFSLQSKLANICSKARGTQIKDLIHSLGIRNVTGHTVAKARKGGKNQAE